MKERIEYGVGNTVILKNLVSNGVRIYTNGTRAVIVDCCDDDLYELYFYDNEKPIPVYLCDFYKASTVVLVKPVKSINKYYPKGTEAILIGDCSSDYGILDFHDDAEPVGVESSYFEQRQNMGNR